MLTLIYAVAIGLSGGRDGDRRAADRRGDADGARARRARRSPRLVVAMPLGIVRLLLAPPMLADGRNA